MKSQIDGSNKTNLATLIWTYLGDFLVATSLLVAFTVLAKPAHSETHALKAEMQFIFYFYPKYEYRNCIISVRYTEKSGSWTNMNETFSDTLRSHLLSEEPAAAGFGYIGKPHPGGYTYLVDFTDECPRREEIMSTVITKLNKEYPTVNFSIIDTHPDIPPGSIGSELWIDSEAYRPENWQRKMDAAGSCEPNPWAGLAEFHRHKNGPFDEYFTYVYSLTAAHLSNRPEHKIKRIKSRPSNLTASQRTYIDELIFAYLKLASCSS